MGAVNQFLVLKRDNKWVVKSGDLEKLFSTQREAVDAAIRLANDSGKEGKPGVVLFQKSKSEFETIWEIRREFLPAYEIRFTCDPWDTKAGKVDGHNRLDGSFG